MSPPIAVVFSVYNRPRLLKKVLDGWSKVRGIENARLEFYCEPGCPEAVRLCQAADFAEHSVVIHPVRLGHATSVRLGMAQAFQLTDYAIQALDDYYPSTDILEMHNWHRNRYGGDGSVLCLRSATDRKHSGGTAAIWRTQLMGGLPGFHRHKWAIIEPRWAAEATDQGWWWWVDEQFCMGGPKMDILAPALSRAEDLGDTHCGSCFTENPGPVDYFEVTGAVERGFTRQTVRTCCCRCHTKLRGRYALCLKCGHYERDWK